MIDEVMVKEAQDLKNEVFLFLYAHLFTYSCAPAPLHKLVHQLLCISLFTSSFALACSPAPLQEAEVWTENCCGRSQKFLWDLFEKPESSLGAKVQT